MNFGLSPLILVTFFPLVGFLVILFLKEEQKTAIRWTALVTSLVTFGISIGILAGFDQANPDFQFVVNVEWLRIGSSLPVSFHLGVDGLSILLVLLTTFLTPIAILSTWSAIQERV